MISLAVLGCAATAMASASVDGKAGVLVDTSIDFDHRFKGAGLAPIKGQTPWERKHGILPGGKGFAYDVGHADPEGAADRDRLQGTTCEALRGFFVRPCESVNTPFDPPDQTVTTVDTRYYASNGAYELDRTYYIGDKTARDCVPDDTDIYYKLNLHGSVYFHGANPIPDYGCEAQMKWNTTDIILGSNTFSQLLARDLDTYCPCGHDWTSNPAGGVFHVVASDCGNEVNPNNKALPRLCHYLAGGSDYYNYNWAPPKTQLSYITSRDDFETTGYANRIDPNYIRERIEESGRHNPADCEGKLWSQCGAGIIAAEENCRSCIGLECDGCLFREINPGAWNPQAANNTWHNCCPCIYKYAQELENNWLQTLC